MIGLIGLVSLRIMSLFVCITIGFHIFSFVQKKRVSYRISRLFMAGLFGLALTTSLSLIWLLVSENFSYAYVAEYTGRGLSLIYRIAAFWGGSAGSLLFWVLVLSLYGMIVAYTKHPDREEMLPIVNVIVSFILLFYDILLNFGSNPFERLPLRTLTGSGLSPLLQNPGMTVHPVNLYLGYIGFTIPYAYAMAGLILRKTDSNWLLVTRKWTLISWLFLGIGIIYGAHWSYEELGWGGYWAWDPVENASLLPWLTATAFMHSSIVQERRGMLRLWNVLLITITFLLTLFGTFLVRSGAIWSIHAFANGPMGRYYLLFIAIVLSFSAIIILSRFRTLQGSPRFESLTSRETTFALNNFLFIVITLVILWGTLFPIVSTYLHGQPMVVSQSYYNGVVLPLGVIVLSLIGVGQFVHWRKDSWIRIFNQIKIPILISLVASTVLTVMLQRLNYYISLFADFALFTAIFTIACVFLALRSTVKNTSVQKWSLHKRRGYGAQIAHLAFAVMVIGIIGSGSYHVNSQVTLRVGESAKISDFNVTFLGLGTANDERRATKNIYADLLVKRESKTLGMMRPSATFYENGQAPMANVTLYSRPLRDFYVVLLGIGDDNKQAIFDFHMNPLVEWIWFGGYMLIFGTFISLWPKRVHRHKRLRLQGLQKGDEDI